MFAKPGSAVTIQRSCRHARSTTESPLIRASTASCYSLATQRKAATCARFWRETVTGAWGEAAAGSRIWRESFAGLVRCCSEGAIRTGARTKATLATLQSGGDLPLDKRDSLRHVWEPIISERRLGSNCKRAFPRSLQMTRKSESHRGQMTQSWE